MGPPPDLPPNYEDLVRSLSGIQIPRNLFESDSQSNDAEDGGIIVIGIDFGTTFTGVAWATETDFKNEHINLITTWPGSGREEGKTPTELYYEDDETITWGYEIDGDADPIRWFKLLLLNEEDLPPELRASEFVLRARKMLRDTEKTATDLISDFLRVLWKHILETITRDRGEALLDALQFVIVITVPAIWKGYARQNMEKAAARAGMLNRRPAGETILSFVPEPEAAALSVLCEPGRQVKKDDMYLVCDAGGGTVDLITYHIEGTRPLLVNEAVEGTGGLCGGVFIDEAFERMIKKRLGRKWDRLSQAGIKSIMKGEWESSIKPQFKPMNPRKEYIVSIPAEAFDNQSLNDTTKEPFIKNGRIHLKGSHIEPVFARVFTDIDKLIDIQIRRAQSQGRSLTGIILVGGLGASPYLFKHLKDRHAPKRISILQSAGMKPRTAICRGAIYKGFLRKVPGFDADGIQNDIVPPIQITSTVSRASYGISFQTKFNNKIHLREDRRWDTDELEWKADNQMSWFLKKGENVSAKNPVSHSFYHMRRSNDNNIFALTIWQCEDDSPPTRTTGSVERYGQVESTIDVPYPSLKDYTNPKGETMKRLEYDVKMVPSGASLEFAVFLDGRKLGKSHVAVEF